MLRIYITIDFLKLHFHTLNDISQSTSLSSTTITIITSLILYSGVEQHNIDWKHKNDYRTTERCKSNAIISF